MNKISEDSFKEIVGNFCTGVAIICGRNDEAPLAMTVQSFVSLSLQPQLIAFCPANSSTTWPSIRKGGAFSVNLLADSQADLCLQMARSASDKFLDTPWKPGALGVPLLEHSIAYMECELAQEVEGGDHTIAVGRVVAVGKGSLYRHDPLLFHKGQLKSLTSGV